MKHQLEFFNYYLIVKIANGVTCRKCSRIKKYNKVPAFELINQWKKYLNSAFHDANNGKYKMQVWASASNLKHAPQSRRDYETKAPHSSYVGHPDILCFVLVILQLFVVVVYLKCCCFLSVWDCFANHNQPISYPFLTQGSLDLLGLRLVFSNPSLTTVMV